MKYIRNVGRGLLLAAFALFLFGTAAEAAPSSPLITQTDWRTGEIDVNYSGVTPGNLIMIYTKTYKDAEFQVHDVWTAAAESENHIVKYLENGQTVWFYITQVDALTGEESAASNQVRQTPPITAFVINWPDMLANINDLFNNLISQLQQQNDALKDHLNGLATPSEQAMDDLKSSVDGLKDALGVGTVNQVGSDLTNGLNNAQSGMLPPAIVDDGVGTYTGGSGGLKLPNTTSTNEIGLVVPNVDEGTDTELTMRIPITQKMDGSLFYIKIFTKEQLDKMKWLGLLRTLAAATIYILFAFWLVTRFTPQLKS